jgi:branched-chain amino acid transport system permease protein
MIGGIAIGAFETLWSAYLPIEGRDLALYLVLVGVIVLRPSGFAGCQTRDRI